MNKIVDDIQIGIPTDEMAEIYPILQKMEEDGFVFNNGVTACFYHVVATILKHTEINDE